MCLHNCPMHDTEQYTCIIRMHKILRVEACIYVYIPTEYGRLTRLNNSMRMKLVSIHSVYMHMVCCTQQFFVMTIIMQILMTLKEFLGEYCHLQLLTMNSALMSASLMIATMNAVRMKCSNVCWKQRKVLE